ATKVIVSQNRLHQSFLACGTSAAVAAIQTDPRIKFCNMERQGNSLQYVKESIDAKADFIQLFGGTVVNPEYVELARSKGLRVNFCCTNDSQVLRNVLSAGVEFPLVDDLHEMMTVAVKEGIPPLRPVFRARGIPGTIETPLSLLEERIPLETGAANQGLAISENFFFTSNANSIIRYSRDWKFIEQKNIRLPGVNHIGAIDYHDGFIWAGFLNGPEKGMFDAANNKAVVAKIDAESLQVVASWDLTDRLDWIDPVCFDGMHLWVGDLSDLGIHRYRIDGDQMVHAGTLRYPKGMHFSQGIRIEDGRLYSIHTFGSLDGLFEFSIPESLNESPVQPTRVWKIPELYTHAEGFAFLPGTVDEIWHAQSKHVERIKLRK
ncbi:MAG: hypothetical protein VX776_09915, partial [Planctomycetota bacterium]|nr:hypothetical protein [Planctomycetota bacterium]